MAASSIVRISKTAKEVLEALSHRSGEPMLNVLDKAIEEYRRRVFLKDVNQAYSRLRTDRRASEEFDSEIAAWDATLMDGLDNTEWWNEKGKSGKKSKGRQTK